ncbi:MAG: hypothetical protein ACIARR_05980 [Phycisphaerales bacterium JB059]
MSTKLNKGIAALTLSTVACLGAVSSVSADIGPVLGFEADQLGAAGVSAVNNEAITDQFAGLYGVEFSIVDPFTMNTMDALPLLTQVGANFDGTYPNHDDGFLSQINDTFDEARPGFEDELGGWFLRTKSPIDANPGSLLMTMTDGPVNYVTGQIWDIDGDLAEAAGVAVGTEQWRVVALDSDGFEIDAIVSPIGDSPDPDVNPYESAPWNWAFDHAENDIFAVRIDFIGTREAGAGLGFDNFSTVPTPGVASLLGLGALMTAKRRRRNA